MRQADAQRIERFFKTEIRFGGALLTPQGLFAEIPIDMERMVTLKLSCVGQDLLPLSVTSNGRSIKVKSILAAHGDGVTGEDSMSCLIVNSLRRLEPNGYRYEVEDHNGEFKLIARRIRGTSSIKIPLIGASRLHFSGKQWYVFTILDLTRLVDAYHEPQKNSPSS